MLSFKPLLFGVSVGGCCRQQWLYIWICLSSVDDSVFSRWFKILYRAQPTCFCFTAFHSRPLKNTVWHCYFCHMCWQKNCESGVFCFCFVFIFVLCVCIFLVGILGGVDFILQAENSEKVVTNDGRSLSVSCFSVYHHWPITSVLFLCSVKRYSTLHFLNRQKKRKEKLIPKKQ